MKPYDEVTDKPSRELPEFDLETLFEMIRRHVASTDIRVRERMRAEFASFLHSNESAVQSSFSQALSKTKRCYRYARGKRMAYEDSVQGTYWSGNGPMPAWLRRLPAKKRASLIVPPRVRK